MNVTIDPSRIRRQNLRQYYGFRASMQGFDQAEASRRAWLWDEVEEVATAQMLSVSDAAALGGEPGVTGLNDPSLTTDRLEALVSRRRNVPAPGSSALNGYVRHGWTDGPHGLFP